MKNYKLYIYLILFAVQGVLLWSCDDNDEKGDLLKVSDYKFAFKDYTTLPSTSFPYSNLYFTPNYPAKEFIPDWLFSRYYTVAEGSTALITYDFRDYDQPETLTKLSQEIKTFTYNEYKYAWDDIYATFFTPSKSAETQVPVVLDALIDAEDGDYKIVRYDYSATEAIIEYDKEIVYFSEDFNGLLGDNFSQFTYAGWYNSDVSGIGKKWQTRKGTGDNRIAMAYSRSVRGSDSWLINEKAIDLKNSLNPILTFTYGSGYYEPGYPDENMDCMTLNLTDYFNGTNPSLSEWKDVSQESGIRDVDRKVSAYPSTFNLSLDISDFAGKFFFLGFRYYLPTRAANYTKSPLYYVDNVKVSEKRDVASVPSTEGQYAIFMYADGQWNIVDDSYYILQDTDYVTINLPSLSAIQASQHLPGFLNGKFNNATVGAKKVVVYKMNETLTGAGDFEYTSSGWKEAAKEIETQTDKYVFKNDTKWTYNSTAN